jgi:DNA-binding transcriptional MerR regulator
MSPNSKERYSLAELAEESGVPGRTLRFYIARGLLAGPDKAGRNAGYGATHLAQLQRIRELQSQGRTLSDIATLGQGAKRTSEDRPVRTEAWRHYEISSDVVLMVRESVPPWSVRALVNAVQRANVSNKQEEKPSPEKE